MVFVKTERPEVNKKPQDEFGRGCTPVAGIMAG